MSTLKPMNATSSGKWFYTCHRLPPHINSPGLWGTWQILEFAMPQLQLQIFLLVALTLAIHAILKPLGQPKIVSQMIAGLILGPSVIGHIPGADKVLFPYDTQNLINTFSMFGYMLYLFVSGVKMDLGMVAKTGRKAVATGLLAFVAPLIVGWSTILIIDKLTGYSAKRSQSLATLLAMSPFPVISTLLSELKLLNSELGRLGLSSAVVSEILSISQASFSIVIRNYSDISPRFAMIELASIIAYVLFAFLVFRRVMFWVIRQTPEGRPINELYINFIMLTVLFGGLISHKFGNNVTFGAFVLGLAIPDGPPLGSAIVEKLDYWVMGWLMPIFVSLCVYRVNIFAFFDPPVFPNILWLNAIILIVTFAVKVFATMLPPIFAKVPFYDSLSLALIMSCKGGVELQIAGAMRDGERWDEATYAMMVIFILIIASGVPTVVNRLYNPLRKYAGYQKRSIMYSKPEGELRVLACIHKSDNITAIIKLLDASRPTRENPIAVYVIHLIELIGRSSPIFISHQMQKKVVSNRSYSEDVIHAFSIYQRHNREAVVIQAFTAISPPKLMHEDICTLALNKLTSLIIIPFHRQWSGGVMIGESEENRYLRNLNRSVLDLAPCSVAILIDRGQMEKQTHTAYNVAVLFIGGNDDREALCYARRMARDSGNLVRLSVVQFLTNGNDSDKDHNVTKWEEHLLDAEVLNDIKHNNANGHVTFKEEVVEDGPNTALIVRTMAEEFDLIIVGRRHQVESPQTSGLSEWCEFPELGIIGDLLAAADVKAKASALVVQQQKHFR